MKLIDIAFDLDGTLIHLMPVFERIIWEKYKAKVPSTRSFKIFTEPELDYETIMWCFGEAFKCIDEIEIIPGVRELFNILFKLADKKDPIKIITARPLSSANDTYKLCERICKNVDYELVIVETSDNKIKHLNRHNHYVDDRRKTCLHLASYNKTLWMPKKHYNHPIESPENLMVIDNIDVLIPWAGGFIKEV